MFVFTQTRPPSKRLFRMSLIIPLWFLVIKAHELKVTLPSHSFYFNSLYFVNYLLTNKLIQDLSTKQRTRQSLTSGDFDVSLEPGPTQKRLPLEVKYMGTCIYWELYFCEYCIRSFTALSRLYSHRYIRKRDHKSTFRSKTEVRGRWKKDSLRNSHHWSYFPISYCWINTCFSLLT